jgi:selenocysteine lyase/cysteine desulfurase
MERPDELVKALSARGIVVDYRPGLLRISPNFYNTVEETDRIIAALEELLAERARPARRGGHSQRVKPTP